MQNRKTRESHSVYCNGCGKELWQERGIMKEGVASFRVEWGYFSKKDGEVHSFLLCEECYETITEGFSLPVKVARKRELL